MVVAVKHTSQFIKPKGRNDVDVHVCVCLLVFFFFFFFLTCIILFWFFFHLSLHPSTLLSVCVNLAPSAVLLCCIWTENCRVFFCLFSSSLARNIFVCLCQLCEATLSQILWNQQNTRQGLMQIKFIALCIAHIILQCLNPITSLGSSFSLTHSFSYSFIHSSDCTINRATDWPCFTVYCYWILSKRPVLYCFQWHNVVFSKSLYFTWKHLVQVLSISTFTYCKSL